MIPSRADQHYTCCMFSVTSPRQIMSVEEYLSFEEASSVRHELVDGEVHMQAATSQTHNVTAGNLFALLRNAVDDDACRVFQHDMRLRVDERTMYYPDVMVVCDPEDRNEPFVSNPCLIVEVLSPSTASTDRREKLLAYRRLPALQAYIIVYQDEPHVVRHWRDKNGAWWQTEIFGLANEETVRFPCPVIDLSLARIYRGADESGSG